MLVTIVHVWVLPDKRESFIEACILNHNESVKEPGNLRFDLLQDSSDETKFTLYEAYETEEASAAHKNTDHYKTWRNAVAEWMAQPRQGVKHTILCPTNKSEW